MILSASRRTDLPNYYVNWLIHRLQEGFVLVRNPMNPHQISRIPLSPSVVDCIVFWTKNPENMLSRLGDLSAYPYYFQFTLTSYGRDIEPYLPSKKDCLIPVFQSLAARIGKDRMVWRYDPILLNMRYTVSYHLDAFAQIAERLRGCTEKVVISFVDLYSKTQRNTRGLSITPPQGKVLLNMVQHLVRIAANNGMVVETCSETIDLQDLGVQHGHCIDARQIERIIGVPLRGKKDRNQRVTCGCMESIDIGAVSYTHLYANELAQRGYIVLTFDPCYMGESEGEPRHISSPELFTENFSAGVDYLGLQPFVDRKRIAVLGICGSGGFALSAAQVDTRIKAVITASLYDCLLYTSRCV